MALIVLAMKPFSLFKLSCFFGVRSLYIVIQTWIEMLKAAIYFNLLIIWRFTIWSIAFLSLPMRLLTALRRERQLEIGLHEMLIELEDLTWDRKELRKKLQATIKEYRMMEAMLAELENEHDEAIIKLEILEGELQDLKDENHRLKEVQGKYAWGQRGDNQNLEEAADNGISTAKTGYDETGVAGHESKIKDVFEKAESGARLSLQKHTPVMVFKNMDAGKIVEQNREVALSRSLFSAILSLLVGMIVWEAEDPCMPLVVALFTVVGMSLKSVVNFFSTIKNKPASDAVALLSLNWFILGTLTYPMLPRVACMLAPLAGRVLEGALRLLGLSF